MFGKGKISQLSNRKKQILTFAACIFLAAVIWVVNALNKAYSVHLSIPVKSATALSALSPEIEKVEIEIKGKGFVIYKLISDLKSFSIDLSSGNTTPADSFFDTRKGLSTLLHPYEKSIELIRIQPEKIALQRPVLYSRKLPVKVNIELTDNNDYIASGPAVVYPDSVWVFSTKPFSEKLQYLETEKTRIDIGEKAFFRSTPLVINETDVYAEKEVVWIYQSAEKSTEVPLRVSVLHIRGLNCIPKQVDLRCRIPVSKFSYTTANKFIVIANKPAKGTDLSIITLRHAPHWCSQIQFQPMSVHCFQANGNSE